MAVPKWRGSAIDVRQSSTITVANTWAQNDTVTITCDNLDFVITIGTLVTTTQVATTIKEAFNGSTLTDTSASCVPSIAQGGAASVGNFAEMTAASSGAVVTLVTNQTLRVGKPVTITVTETTAGTGTATYAVATAPRGRNEGDNQDNYDTNAVPTDADTLVFDAGDVDFLYDISFAAQFTTLNKTKSYTGKVGLAEINVDNPSIGKSYREYRGKYLVTDDNGGATCTANLETGEGQGSSRFRWNAGAGIAVLNVFGKGNRELTGVPCILFLGTAATNVVNNIAGDLGIAFYPGESATVATLRNGDGPGSQAETYCGTGCTLTTVICNGGKIFTSSAITTATLNDGAWSHDTGTVATANVLGGVWNHLGGATITTLKIGPTGKFDASKGVATFAVTNPIQMSKGAEFYDPQGRSGNPVFVLATGVTWNDVKINIGGGKTLTAS